MHKQILLYVNVTPDLIVALGLHGALELTSVSRGTTASQMLGKIRLQP